MFRLFWSLPVFFVMSLPVQAQSRADPYELLRGYLWFSAIPMRGEMKFRLDMVDRQDNPPASMWELLTPYEKRIMTECIQDGQATKEVMVINMKILRARLLPVRYWDEKLYEPQEGKGH